MARNGAPASARQPASKATPGLTGKRGRSTRKPSAKPELVAITGLSGSGKASVLKALEDLGFYSVDNLPMELIPKFAELIRDAQPGTQAAHDAVVVLEEFDNLERIAARLLTLARMDERSTVKPSVVPIGALLNFLLLRFGR